MKPNYKNWVPKGMIFGMLGGAAASGVLLAAVLLTELLQGPVRTAAVVILGVLAAVLLVSALFCVHLYNAFSYDGKQQFARRIIDHVSDYVVLPEGGTGLDVGCGSGALTIACAKKNPQGTMVGLDRWGKEYAAFSRQLCEDNARIEGVKDRVSFRQGNACSLDFPDGTFDAVTSNYCYHNIPSRDRQAIILETLRVLKKGGTFAIHDEFIKEKYGDMDRLLETLRAQGYEKVELLDTADGLFCTRKEAGSLCLTGSRLLLGKK